MAAPRPCASALLCRPCGSYVCGGQRAVCCRSSTTDIAVVHDIVVDQGEGLEELQGGSNAKDRVGISR